MTVVVGTAGHIDHGKTTLLRVLTGIDADRLPEERRRGMTIDVGYAHLALPDGSEIDFVDVPGHDRLVANMLVGAGEIDAALLVVAADDGPRAQTLEHVALLDALDVRHGLAVVTKADVAGPARAAEVVEATRRLLEATSVGSPVIAVSAVSGDGIDALRDLLIDLRDRVGALAGRAHAGGSRLAIDRVFAVRGRGNVVTGSLRGRPLESGRTLRLVPGDRSVRVREIQVHGAAVARVEPGRTALNLSGVDAADLHRGLVLTDDPAVVASDRLLVRLAAPLPDRGRARLHLGTAAVDAAVGRSGRDAIDLADGTPVAIVRLTSPIAVAPGDRFVLRRTGGTTRIVGGLVLDAEPTRGVSRRRQTVDRVGRLAAAVESGDAVAAAAARTDLHGVVRSPVGSDPAEAVAADLLEAAESAVVGLAGGAPGGAALTDARASVTRVLRRGSSVTRTAVEPLAAAIVDRLVRDGRLDRDGAVVRLPGVPAPGNADSDPDLAVAMDRLERALAVPGPPGLAAAAADAGCGPDGIRALERNGRIVVLEPDLAYATTAYRDLTARAVAMARTAPLTPAALRDATGTSRKYVMAILADLDRRAILRRTPDGHVPGPRAS